MIQKIRSFLLTPWVSLSRLLSSPKEANVISVFTRLSVIFSPVTADKKQSWSVARAEGTAVVKDKRGHFHTGKIESLSLNFLVLKAKFGQLVYGLINKAWDQWAFFGGTSEKYPMGVWIALITIIDGVPYVASIDEKRPLIEGPVLAIPHGFVDAGEDGMTAAVREMVEETGILAESIRSVGFFSVNTAFFSSSSNGGQSDEGFVIVIKGSPESLKFGPKEHTIKFVPAAQFIRNSYCGPSVTVTAKAIAEINSISCS